MDFQPGMVVYWRIRNGDFADRNLDQKCSGKSESVMCILTSRQRPACIHRICQPFYNAYEIVVLQKGQIVERSKDEELIAQGGGIYKKPTDLQSYN